MRLPWSVPLAALLLVVVAIPSGARGPSSPVGERLSGASPLPAGCADAVPPDSFAPTPGLERETSTAVRPGKHRVQAVAWLQDDARAVVVARTDDGGRTWSSGVVPGVGACAEGPEHQRYLFHPRIGFGHDGRLWLAVMAVRGAGLDPRNLVAEVLVTTTTGVGWSPPAQLAELQGVLGDLDTLAVSPDRPGTAWVAHDTDTFAPGQRVSVSRSTDGGRTWQRRDVATLPAGVASFGQVRAVGGEVVLLATTQSPISALAGLDDSPSRVVVYRSTDSGETWQQVLVEEGVRLGEWPGVTPSSLVWRAPTADGGYQVRVRRTGDRGATWSPVEVAGAGTTAAVLTTNLGAAEGPEGELGVLLVDVRPDGSTADVRALLARRAGAWRSEPIATGVDLAAVPGADSGRITDAAATPTGLVAAVPLAGAAWSPAGPTDVFAVSARW